MNPGHGPPGLVGELLSRRGELRLAHDLSAYRFTTDEIHDEPFAQTVLRAQYRAHNGHRHEGCGGKAEQRGFRCRADGATATDYGWGVAGGAPQDQRVTRSPSTKSKPQVSWLAPPERRRRPTTDSGE